MAHPIVFIEFAGPDDATLMDFYSNVLQWHGDDQGRFVVPASNSMQCAIRRDPAEKRIYIGVPDVAVHLALVEREGGVIDLPRSDGHHRRTVSRYAYSALLGSAEK